MYVMYLVFTRYFFRTCKIHPSKCRRFGYVWTWFNSTHIGQQGISISLWVWRIHRVKKVATFWPRNSFRGTKKASWKPSNWIQMKEEIKNCHLTQAGQTARIWYFAQLVLGGNLSGSGLMVFWCHFCPSKRIT